ncbi:MAG TPA: aconitase/3-isopropylmalate dehydratase large subunit family protein [Bacteroidales bacterium]|nr:aconitase/3-isopropylmalate dehydratase large subunit family protein [Bacteroidales bacterium]
MGKTIIEKILAEHSGQAEVKPGQIVDVEIDARVARDFGGANVVKHINDHHLGIDDVSRTFFTFDCNPTGSDQKYAANQHICRIFARRHGIKVYDIDKGIGTHILIEDGLAWPGSTAVSTDSHANILGAIGSFGQGMGDKDIAAAWSKGSIWFKVPASVKLVLKGKFDKPLTAKDIALNLLANFGPDTLLGYAVEVSGDDVEQLTLDDRITISSMATEMGAIILFFPPNREVMRYCESRTGKPVETVSADEDAEYAFVKELNVETFKPMVSRPGNPGNAVKVGELVKIPVDSVFIGSCTNGRITDMRSAAEVLRGRKVAPGVVLKIVPSTDLVWQRCLDEGLIDIFKESGAMVSNAGCAGCAAGQVGQNGPGEVSVSTGNRNFPGKQGQGEVYLASPAIAAASAISGFITTPDAIPDKPLVREKDERWQEKVATQKDNKAGNVHDKPTALKGRAWYIHKDHIDTDMIYHNSHLTVTDQDEMGNYAFGNLEGYRDFSRQASKGDIIFTGKNFGAGSSRQQAVDCFISLGIQAIVAESFGAIYERNAINAGFPLLVAPGIADLNLEDGDEVTIHLESGEIKNLTKNKHLKATPFSEVQMEIYQNGGLF